MKTKNIIITIVVLIAIAAGFGMWQYNKPHRDSASEKVAFSLTATELFNAFESDENAAMEKYGNKLVEVTGNVLESSDDKTMMVLESEHPLFGVKCMFQESFEASQSFGDEITIKGFCSGINGDVELTRCSIKKQ